MINILSLLKNRYVRRLMLLEYFAIAGVIVMELASNYYISLAQNYTLKYYLVIVMTSVILILCILGFFINWRIIRFAKKKLGKK